MSNSSENASPRNHGMRNFPGRPPFARIIPFTPRHFGQHTTNYYGATSENSQQYIGCDIHGRVSHAREPRRRSRSPSGGALPVSYQVKAVQNALPLVEREFALHVPGALAEISPLLQATPKQCSMLSNAFAKVAHSIYTQDSFQLGFSYFASPDATPPKFNYTSKARLRFTSESLAVEIAAGKVVHRPVAKIAPKQAGKVAQRAVAGIAVKKAGQIAQRAAARIAPISASKVSAKAKAPSKKTTRRAE
eukprot:GEMP01064691.1.p1 GENE.GEMP01064691.1~~GEMP01064691.1.p1  ORF type:complete len:260 (+),score=28.24 GEMP01064691.1:37-780(+)